MSETLRLAQVPALSAIPGLVHGFEMRQGPPESREDARRRVARALLPRGRLHVLTQVHGVRVHQAPWGGAPPGDAGLAAARGEIVAVETADCLPILVADPAGRRAAAVHAGWRGTAGGIARQAIEALAALGSREADLVAALGPCIGACCYEVGEEVREAFGPARARFFVAGRGPRPHLDLRAANAAQLFEAGVGDARIHHVRACTFCDAANYHSFRREGRGAGRMMSFIGWDASAPA